MRKMLALMAGAALTACSDPPCLAHGEHAGVLAKEDIANTQHPRTWVQVKFQMRDRTVRVCALRTYQAQMLEPSDIVRGPIYDDAYRVQ